MKKLNSLQISLRTTNSLSLTSCSITAETEKAILITGYSNAVGCDFNRLMQGWLPKSVLTVNQYGSYADITISDSFKKRSLFFI